MNSAKQTYSIDLFSITLTGGAVIRYTSADRPITLNGNTYLLGPVITRGKSKLSVGVSVDTLDVTVAADATQTINGVPLLQFVANGGLDNALMSVDRAFAADPLSPQVGTLNLFQGRVADTKCQRYSATLTVNSASELLNVMIPRNVYMPGCSNTLFDGTCLVNKAAYSRTAFSNTATDATLTTFNVAGTLVVGFYALGWAVGLTGANAGVGRTIKSSGSASIQVINPWPQPVAIGDSFTLYAGCDKTMTTCQNKFSNLVNFRGTPFVPNAEASW